MNLPVVSKPANSSTRKVKRRWSLRINKYSEDLLILIGFLAILIGSYQIQPIYAWFVGGFECLLAGVVLAWSKRK